MTTSLSFSTYGNDGSELKNTFNVSSLRPSTEQKIEKHLIKTGVSEIDEELLLIGMCLSRIEKKFNSDLSEIKIQAQQQKQYQAAAAAQKLAQERQSLTASSSQNTVAVVQTTSENPSAASAASNPAPRTPSTTNTKGFVETTIGTLVDASHRGEMGSRPDDALHTKDAVLHRTDITLALSSVRRVANAAAEALHNFDACRFELQFLREKTQRQEVLIEQQEKQLRFFQAQLEQLSSPEAIYEAFRTVWEAEAVTNSNQTEEQLARMQQNMADMRKNKAVAYILSKESVARQQILNETADKTLAIVGAIDVDKIGHLFKEKKASGSDEWGTNENQNIGPIDTQIDIAEMTDTTNFAANPNINYTALNDATERVLAEQSRQCDYHITEKVEKYAANGAITNARQAADAISECDEPVQFSRQTDTAHFVIRRSTGDKSSRVVRMQGSSTSIVGKIASAILYSPADILEFEVDIKSTLGRKQQLKMQAEELHLAAVWDELCQYSRPYLNVVHFRVNKSLELQSKRRDFDVRPLVLDEIEGVVAFEEKRRQQEKRLAFKRLEEGIVCGRDGSVSTHQHFPVPNPHAGSDFLGASPADNHSKTLEEDAKLDDAAYFKREELREYTTQVPGIVSFIAHENGLSEDWRDPVEKGLIRVLASSVMRPAELSNVVRPFRDRHSNFFSTRDEPGQWIEISFEQTSILPSGYSLSCTHPIACASFPRSWRLEGSSDRVRWATLLRHINDDSISRYTPTWAWTLPRDAQQTAFYSYFRIVNEGPNASGGDALCISCFEVYGKAIFISSNPRPSTMRDGTIPNDRPAGFAPLQPIPQPKESGRPAPSKKKK